MTIENKRVYELAKEYGMQNKDFIEYLETKLDIKVKSHSSNLTPEQIEKIKASFAKPKEPENPVKKPKAFIIKKPKPQPVEPKIQEENIQKNIEEPEEIPNKPAVIKNEMPETSETPELNEEKSEVQEVPEEKPVIPQFRSLLEYNNRNSQKRRQEMMAKQKQQEADKNRQAREKDMQRLGAAPKKDKGLYKNERPIGNEKFNRDSKPERFERGQKDVRFDKKNQFQKQNSENKPGQDKQERQDRQDRQDRPFQNKKPIQHHIISQEIYDGKSGQNPAFKKKGVKEKKKQYKNKEEEQELISLEKAISQKHKKKSKDSGELESIKQVVINRPLTVGELADKIGKSPAEIVKFLMMQGILTTVNEVISEETQKKICANFELEVLEEDLNEYIEKELEKEEQQKALQDIDESLLEHRAPVISIMGHVDHGKTTLLDSIRASKHKIVATEVGGITQSIGAYTVYLEDNKDKKIVFIDTPGHEAFTEMRARGAKATDIAILVVAADDGIMPQTIEAINHARAAEVPIIVAVNKIDKPSADPDKIMQQLTEYGLVPEEWGGDTICVKVSALQGKGIDELLEYILLLSEVQNLRANRHALASGVIIEAKLDKGKGPVATLLVQNGTLHTGDCFVVGSVCGKVRALISDSGERIKEAGPSTPVEILGLTEVPQAGDRFEAVENEKVMHSIADTRKEKERNTKLDSMKPAHIRNEQVGDEDDNIKRLNLIIKANTHGSAEAVSQGVSQLESKEIITKIVHVGVGDISEADVMLASASNAIILGFTVKEDINAQIAAEKHNVTIKKYNIIYQVLEDLEHTMLSLLEPEIKEISLGQAEVRQIFTIGKTTKIAGCYVTEGKIVRNKTAALIRNGVEVFKGQIDQLKRFKDDVKEVAQGFECGISFEKFNDIREGDIIKVTTTEEVERQVLI
ncbi:MAG: translation initiation factor IF-2 [Candidatus Gastranaerophilales bacterium]|nr:translation initiation factor IF-2 [Candidatus Gastranaerophilales bacterium]